MMKINSLQTKERIYIKDINFDFINRIYTDNEKCGTHHPNTSHPRFVKHFSHETYYLSIDNEAPFSGDKGSDTLTSLIKAIRKNPHFDFETFPQNLTKYEWEIRYVPCDTLDKDKVKEMDIIQSNIVTYATAFAQIAN